MSRNRSLKAQQPHQTNQSRRTVEMDNVLQFQTRKVSYRPVDLIPRTKNQESLVLALQDAAQHIVVTVGPAGTGKTYVACAQALKLLKSDPRFKKIILVKSVTVLEGEEVGFLKGDLKDKMYPFTISFLDNFHKLIGEALTQIMLDQGFIEVLPLAYIRGRSIDN